MFVCFKKKIKIMFMLLPRDKYAKTLSKLATILQETILFV